MIFVTVGSLLPFDPLVSAVDEWATNRTFSDRIFAQVAESTYQPKAIETKKFLNPIEYRQLFEASDLVVSHAGMGTIILALELGKPLIVMPRSDQHCNNNHQIATVKHFQRGDRIRVAENESELKTMLDEAVTQIKQRSAANEPAAIWPPDPQLIERVREFIRSK